MIRLGTLRTSLARRFARQEDGAVLVEFALVFPMMLLMFGVTVEATRMLWTYQKTISGVRDASRYIGRAADFQICGSGPTEIAAWETKLTGIVEEDILGENLFFSGVDVLDVDLVLNCIDDDSLDGGPNLYAADEVIVATVSAEVLITFPLGNIFALFGDGLDSVNTTVADSVRIYGQ
jgi:hypothetical protein